MKKIIILFVLFLIFGCSEAERLEMQKNQESMTTGLTRKIIGYSSFTGQVVFERTIENSYFTSGVSGGIDILDLKTKKKISIRGEGYILVIDEL